MKTATYKNFRDASQEAKKLAISGYSKVCVISHLDQWIVKHSTPNDELYDKSMIPKLANKVVCISEIRNEFSATYNNTTAKNQTSDEVSAKVNIDANKEKNSFENKYSRKTYKNYKDLEDDEDDEDDEEEIQDEEVLDIMNIRDREEDYWGEIGSQREDGERSSNDGWYYPDEDGSYIDNF